MSNRWRAGHHAAGELARPGHQRLFCIAAILSSANRSARSAAARWQALHVLTVRWSGRQVFIISPAVGLARRADMSPPLLLSPVAAGLACELELGVQVVRRVLVHRQRLAQPKVGQLDRAVVKDQLVPAAPARCGSLLRTRRPWSHAQGNRERRPLQRQRVALKVTAVPAFLAASRKDCDHAWYACALLQARCRHASLMVSDAACMLWPARRGAARRRAARAPRVVHGAGDHEILRLEVPARAHAPTRSRSRACDTPRPDTPKTGHGSSVRGGLSAHARMHHRARAPARATRRTRTHQKADTGPLSHAGPAHIEGAAAARLWMMAPAFLACMYARPRATSSANCARAPAPPRVSARGRRGLSSAEAPRMAGGWRTGARARSAGAAHLDRAPQGQRARHPERIEKRPARHQLCAPDRRERAPARGVALGAPPQRATPGSRRGSSWRCACHGGGRAPVTRMYGSCLVHAPARAAAASLGAARTSAGARTNAATGSEAAGWACRPWQRPSPHAPHSVLGRAGGAHPGTAPRWGGGPCAAPRSRTGSRPARSRSCPSGSWPRPACRATLPCARSRTRPRLRAPAPTTRLQPRRGCPPLPLTAARRAPGLPTTAQRQPALPTRLHEEQRQVHMLVRSPRGHSRRVGRALAPGPARTRARSARTQLLHELQRSGIDLPVGVQVVHVAGDVHERARQRRLRQRDELRARARAARLSGGRARRVAAWAGPAVDRGPCRQLHSIWAGRWRTSGRGTAAHLCVLCESSRMGFGGGASAGAGAHVALLVHLAAAVHEQLGHLRELCSHGVLRRAPPATSRRRCHGCRGRE